MSSAHDDDNSSHLQTVYTVLRQYDIPVYYKRRILAAEDSRYAGSFAIDFTVPEHNVASDASLPPRTGMSLGAESFTLSGAFGPIESCRRKSAISLLEGLTPFKGTGVD